MKFGSVIAVFAALVATSFAMDQPSFNTKGVPTGKPTGTLKPGDAHQDPDAIAEVLRILKANDR
jgi:hypothetical protein